MTVQAGDGSGQSDEQLMAEYQSGRYEAFEEIYRRYCGRVYGYYRNKIGNCPAVDDLFQKTFQKLHQSKNRYDPKYALKAWLFTICHNTLVDYFRSEGRHRELPVSDVQRYEKIETPSAPNALVSAAVAEMDRLPELQKRAVGLRYGENLCFDEIAARLEVSPANARQLVSRGIRKLRKLLLAGQ